MTGEEFRKKRMRQGLTQEAIARVICRSIATVRVWEASANREREIIDPLTAKGIDAAISDYEQTGRMVA